MFVLRCGDADGQAWTISAPENPGAPTDVSFVSGIGSALRHVSLQRRSDAAADQPLLDRRRTGGKLPAVPRC